MSQTIREYVIKPATQTVPLCGHVAGTPWQGADVLAIDNWPWYQGGDKQPTEARLLYDDAAIYVQFQCEDKHIYSEAAELNGDVYKDSCVELFASVEPEAGPDYFNFEANCCGVFHLGFGAARQGRKLVTAALAARVDVASSEAGPTRDESPDDARWWLAARLPFDLLSEFAGRSVSPKAGDYWMANFYRCGGKTDEQYACWNPIIASQPDFHRPECFGPLVFA